MKRCVLIVGLLLAMGFRFSLQAAPTGSKGKETSVDLSDKKSIFIGWVNLSPDEWSVWGYESGSAWEEIIKDLNLEFQKDLADKYLAGRTVTGAKDSKDENPAGNDLYVKFSDVSIDKNYYGVRLAIHFIDPKTNTEIVGIPSRLYYEKRMWQFQKYIAIALDDIGKKIGVEVTGSAPKK